MQSIQVLDHGFVRLVETWGSGDTGSDPEAGIIEAARQSTQGSFRGWSKDAQLLRHLFENHHATPFEFAGMVIEVRAPIFVFREWHRHRTQSYNEMSARYSPLPELDYMPTIDRLMCNAGGAGNKQAGSAVGSQSLTRKAADHFLIRRSIANQVFQQDYVAALRAGVPKELARIGMPVGRYSQMRASTSLRNWLAFLTLRMSPKAQWEIRQYANAVGELIQENFPRTWELFAETEPGT